MVSGSFYGGKIGNLFLYNLFFLEILCEYCKRDVGKGVKEEVVEGFE